MGVDTPKLSQIRSLGNEIEFLSEYNCSNAVLMDRPLTHLDPQMRLDGV
jgi:hypothetical protein